MTDEQADVEKLLNAFLPFAKHSLSKHGEFHPFAGVIKANGEVAFVAAHDGREHPPSSELIELLVNILRQGAVAKDHIATVLVYDARVVPPAETAKTDAIAMQVEHQSGYARTVFFPYSIPNGELKFGSAFATPERRDIFQSS